MNDAVKKVLIVDDESVIRQSFMDYFEDRLWHPVGADSGEQALEVLEAEAPHGAVVDIRLRGMNGDEFIRKAYQRKPETAFVIGRGKRILL